MSPCQKHRIVVTCGPSYEPIDEVRRITNSSTGKLGITLANSLAAAGWPVVCLKGVGATCPELLHPTVEVIAFRTNADLLVRLAAIPERENIHAVFHAAALCDFRVKSASTRAGDATYAGKISSREGDLSLVLEPAPKVIASLRGLFPGSRIVGWKYEIEGTRQEAVEKGMRQMAENQTDACVINGAAYGEGFGVITPGREGPHLGGLEALTEWLAGWLESMKMA